MSKNAIMSKIAQWAGTEDGEKALKTVHIPSSVKGYNKETGELTASGSDEIWNIITGLIQSAEFPNTKHKNHTSVYGQVVITLESLVAFVIESAKVRNENDVAEHICTNYGWLLSNSSKGLKKANGNTYKDTVNSMFEKALDEAIKGFIAKSKKLGEYKSDVFDSPYEEARLLLEPKEVDKTDVKLSDGSEVKVDKEEATVTLNDTNGNEHTVKIPEPSEEDVKKEGSKWRARCKTLIKLLRDLIVNGCRALVDFCNASVEVIGKTISKSFNGLKSLFSKKKEDKKSDKDNNESSETPKEDKKE